MLKKYTPLFEKIDKQQLGNFKAVIEKLKSLGHIDGEDNFIILNELGIRDTPHHNKILLTFFKKNLSHPDISDKSLISKLIKEYYKKHGDSIYGLDNYTDFAKLERDYNRLNIKKDEDKVVFKDRAFTIYEISDPEACRRLNKDGGWCVGKKNTSGGRDWAEQYLEDGVFYFVTTTETNKRVCLIHFERGEARDFYNKSLKKSLVQELYKRWGDERLKELDWEGKKRGEKLT